MIAEATTTLRSYLRDDPNGWRDAYSPPPAGVDIDAYNKRLDERYTVRGHPLYRLVWGGAREERREIEWDSVGVPVKWEMRGLHRTRVPAMPGKVRIQRWLILRWIPPERVEHNSYMRLPGSVGLIVPSHVAQERQKGHWKSILVVADHSKCREEDCYSEEYYCFGDYKAPGNFEIEFLASDFSRISPRMMFEGPTEAEIAADQASAAHDRREQQEREREDARELAEDIVETAGRITVSGK